MPVSVGSEMEIRARHAKRCSARCLTSCAPSEKACDLVFVARSGDWTGHAPRPLVTRPMGRLLHSALAALLAMLVLPLSVAYAEPPAAPLTFAPVVEAIRPAVVNLRPRGATRNEASGDAQETDDENGSEAEDLTAAILARLLASLWQRTVGAGVIVDPSGLVVTTASITFIAKQLEAVTVDGEVYPARVVGLDERSDLAVLKLEAGNRVFAAARLGDSERTTVGDWVVALSSPYGLASTVTAGIITARGTGAGGFGAGFLQTDATLGPGSAGGPLVNVRGEVIGIHVALDWQSRLGLAVPSNLVRRVYLALTERGRVPWAWLGISVQRVTAELTAALGIKDAVGLLVADVVRAGPAAVAGVRRGDLLLRFEGRILASPADLEGSLAHLSPGRRIRLELRRDARVALVEVRLGEEPDELAAPAPRLQKLAGFDVRPITPEMGVVVVEVEPGGPAARAGMQPGDVVREINRSAVRDVQDLDRLSRSLRAGDHVLVLVQRGARALYLAVKSSPK